MSETTITMTELRQRLGAFVNRAAYGEEQIVLISHGQPKAVIVSYEELKRLEAEVHKASILKALEQADRVRETHKQWLHSQGLEPEDSVEILRQLREGEIR